MQLSIIITHIHPLKIVPLLLIYIRKWAAKCGADGFSIEAGRCVVIIEKFGFDRATCWWLRWAHDESNSESDDAGAEDDGRGCPEEVAAIWKRWSDGQVMRGRAAFISWLNLRDCDFLMRAQQRKAPFPLVCAFK
jgi:hypothetical protein